MGGGPERAKTLRGFGMMISATLGLPLYLEYVGGRQSDRKYDVHDVSKFRKDYPDWDYEYSLEDIINDLTQ